MYEYKKKDIQQCFQTRRLVFIGDSTTRQIYWAVARKMDPKKAGKGMAEMQDLDGKHSDLLFESGGVKLQFVWDPWLNSTALEQELKTFNAYAPRDGADESAGLLLVGTPGLWYARYGQENYFKEFRSSIDAVIPYMDHLSENNTAPPVLAPLASRQGSPNLLLMAPVQVPRYQALSPSRVETMTPEKIDQMNDYLQQVSAHSKADLLWSYSLMTWEADAQYEEGGLHVVDNVAKAKADVLLNLRCNADAASRGYPFDRTCCSNYTQLGSAQWAMLLVGMLILPAIFLARRKHLLQTDYYVPAPGVLSALAVFGLVVCYCFYADRTQIFNKTPKQFTLAQFQWACTGVALVGLASLQKSISSSSKATQDHGFLSRDQTDEWKGWMQFVILIYHYTHGSKILGIYKIVRLLIASYLFMTGFGHTLSILKKEDYSFRRAAAVLVRLNLLSVVLPYMMRTDYLFYYFAPLASFWFLVIYLTLRVGHGSNSNLTFLLAKICISATLTTAFTMIPGILEFVSTVLNYTCAISWNVTEWRFRTSLDMYIVYTGMLVAAFSLRYTQQQSGATTPKTITDHLIQLTIKHRLIFKAILLLTALALLPTLYINHHHFPTKQSYNSHHALLSIPVVLSFITLRNSHPLLRNHHSTLFAWLGRCSLETYILQYHIWLAADTKGLLRLGLWDPRIETVLLTGVFLWISWHTASATQRIAGWIVGDGVGRKGDGEAEKKSPYLLPKVRSSDEALSSRDGVVGRESRLIGRDMDRLKENLALRLGLIVFVLWIANITYT